MSDTQNESQTIPVNAVLVGKADRTPSRPFQSLDTWERGTEVPANPPFLLLRTQNESGQSVLVRFDNKDNVIHGRTVADTVVSHKVIWGRGEGDQTIFFGARDIKGGFMDEKFTRPQIYPDSDSPFFCRVQGFKDVIGIARIQKASKFFLEHGLPTEVPVRILRLQEVPYEGKLIPIEEWRLKEFQEIERLKTVVHNDPKKMQELERQLRYVVGDERHPQLDLFLIDRDLQVLSRVEDITKKKTVEGIKDELRPVFQWINAVTQQTHRGILPDTPAPQPFDIDNPSDVKRYYSQWLPEQMGTYLARMHSLNITHGYAHRQNWSLAGTLYDLDSVHGKPFGDMEPSRENYVQDMNDCHTVFFQHMFGKDGPFIIRRNLRQPLFGTEDLLGMEKEANQRFIDAYIQEYVSNTYGEGSIEEAQSHILSSEFAPYFSKE